MCTHLVNHVQSPIYPHLGTFLWQIMSILTDERSPLLEEPLNHKESLPGPRDISRSNRFGILAGVWLATFLSVSPRDTFSRTNLCSHAGIQS